MPRRRISPFQQELEVAKTLPEARRTYLAESAKQARLELERGDVSRGSVEDLMEELETKNHEPR